MKSKMESQTHSAQEGDKLRDTVRYSVMQADGNRFCRDVVLVRYEDSILNQIYEKQIFSDPYYKDLNF